MTVFVTGATGLTGSYTVPLLLKSGYSLRCLYRPTSDCTVLPQPEIEWVQGDVSHTDALSTCMRGADILVNIVSLGFGHADSILGAAKKAGIRRAIFISTTALFTQLDAKSRSLRVEAERLIESSGLRYSVLRPTMIYGSPRDRNMWRLIQFMRTSPILPILGDGNSLQQPIYVGDVAQAILNCLKSDSTIGKSYNIAGKKPLTYDRVIDTITAQMNQRVWKLHIPYSPVVAAMKFLEQIHFPLSIKSEQVLRLNENKNFDYEEAQKDFGFRPLSFSEGIGLELKQL